LHAKPGVCGGGFGGGFGGGGGGLAQDFSHAALSATPPMEGTHCDWLLVELPPHFQPCTHLSVWNWTLQSKTL